MDERSVEFKATYWRFEDNTAEDGVSKELNILIGGITKDLKTVFVRVRGFTPFVYLQLPKRIKWGKEKCQTLFEFFQKRMKSNAPVNYNMQIRYLLHYREQVKVMFLSFSTYEATKQFARICARGRISVYNVGTFSGYELKVHEHNIDPILKFASCKGIKLAGWIKVKETIPERQRGLPADERKFTTSNIDMEAYWKDVNPTEGPKNVIVNPTFCSFDIECYSKNHNSKLPDPEIAENVVFQVSMVFGRLGEQEKEKILITLFDPLDIDGVKVYRFESEKELLLGFTSLIQEKNPDLMLGYNIMKFDWQYLITRSDVLGIYLRFAKLSRLLDERAVRDQKKWSSSAYGDQVFQYFDCHGRVNVDVLLEVERNYKLPKYSLDKVSEYFLKKHKEDVTPRELFMLYQLTNELLEPSKKIDPEIFSKIKARALEILIEKKIISTTVINYREEIKSSVSDEFHYLIRKALQIVGIYCVKDTILPLELSDKLVLWTTMEEMSNCMHIPTSYLHTRGQQIKVLAQVYRETLFKGLIIPYHQKSNDPKDDEKYQGAIVVEANPGFYKNVATLDFASLYPTTMIAFNICYTTLLRDEDETPDEECHVIEFEDHVGCEHDPQKRKKKKSDILCAKHRYRFRKVKIVIHEDGKIERLYEGILPRLERNLLAERKTVKKEMFKMQSRLKMQRGEADREEIKRWASWGWEILEKGHLSDSEEKILEVCCNVLNARQLALKVSANSAYGAMGAKNGFIPLIPGAASVTAMGRRLITKAIDKTLENWDCARLVYGDTDSCMLYFHGKDLKESFNIAESVSHVVTHYLKCDIIGVTEDFQVKYIDPESGEEKLLTLDQVKPCHHKGLNKEDFLKVLEYQDNPIDLEFENMYGKFLLLTKKRYIAYVINKDGDVIAVTKKGVVMARRDNCEFLRETYKKISTGILDEKEEEEIMDELYDRVHALFTMQIKDEDLIIYLGIKDIKEYAKKESSDEVSSDTNRFLDINGNPIEDDIKDPLDSRLVYRNIPQCLLGLKMLKRGDDIPPNTRLEIIYLENPDAIHQGDKAEDYTYYRENRLLEGLRPDPLHYLEKQLAKPVTELIQVRYPREHVPYEKLDDALDRVLSELSPRQKQLVTKTRTFVKKRPNSDENYVYKGKRAKVEYILASAMKGGANEINIYKDVELVEVCKKWKSREILNRCYKQKGVKKRPSKRPWRNGNELPSGTNIMLMRGHDGYSAGTLAKVADVKVEGDEYIYSIVMDEKRDIILKGIPRKDISTYLHRDSTILNDMLKARQYYKQVVTELRVLFRKVDFID